METDLDYILELLAKALLSDGVQGYKQSDLVQLFNDAIQDDEFN